MYELVRAGENTYYIDCPAKIGVYVEAPEKVWLIDSGNDRDAAKRVLRLFEGQGWTLHGVLVTHSHADHIGGCEALASRTGCKVYAPGAEAAFAAKTIFEPSFLYGGFPPAALRNKFLEARPCPCTPLEAAALPDGFEALPLPGHWFDMTGYRTPDGVWFLADCLTSEAVLEKYHIPFIWDVEAYLGTLEAVCRLEGALFVPSHAEACDDISGLARINREKVLGIAADVLNICGRETRFELLLARIFARYNLEMDFNQYVLAGSTLRSLLSWLEKLGAVEAKFENNMLLWHSTGKAVDMYGL